MKEGGAVKRMLEMEKQLADNRKKNMDSFKYHEFHQQVKMIYQSQNKKKAEPTIPDLLKWIR